MMTTEIRRGRNPLFIWSMASEILRDRPVTQPRQRTRQLDSLSAGGG